MTEKKVETTNTTPATEDSSAKVVDVRLIERSGRYRTGAALRPNIHHDNGFLDQFPPEKPTSGDYAQLALWRAKLEGAEAFATSLADATAAYRHFLDGTGSDRTINYERYVESDAAGAKSLKSLTDDFEFNVEVIGHNRERFEVTSEPFPIGSDPVFFPYPATENWQKAIGAHVVWVSGTVSVHTDKTDMKDIFTATMVIHMEDRYNFNPGAQDIATGIPDAANGRFEITGLAKQYTNYGTLTRTLIWKEGQGAKAKISGAPTNRQRKPPDNRRGRNRV